MSDDMAEKEQRHHSRKLRILKSDRERGFKRCRKCRSINPLDAEACYKCGTEFHVPPRGDTVEIETPVKKDNAGDGE